MFFVLGEGRFGLATTGNQVRAGSLFCISPGSPYYFDNKDPRGSQALVLYAPAWSADDDDTEPYAPEEPEPEQPPGSDD